MYSTGIVRKTDQLGRLVLPIELRRTMGIAHNDGLEIFTESDSIILKKYQPACVFCGSNKEIDQFRGKCICNECKTQLAV